MANGKKLWQLRAEAEMEADVFAEAVEASLETVESVGADWRHGAYRRENAGGSVSIMRRSPYPERLNGYGGLSAFLRIDEKCANEASPSEAPWVRIGRSDNRSNGFLVTDYRDRADGTGLGGGHEASVRFHRDILNREARNSEARERLLSRTEDRVSVWTPAIIARTVRMIGAV